METKYIVGVVFFGLALSYGLITWALSWKIKSEDNEVLKSKLMQAQALVNGGFACIFLFFITGTIVQIFNLGKELAMNVAITIIISWLVILVGYYSWAIYFYNINLGWSDERWNRQHKLQSETGSTEEHDRNPHSEETLGLPPGTVRGTIALTLLMVGSALAIASFGFDRHVKPNSEFIDNFEFMKTAFLMMIAFYFGTKALDVFKPATNRNQNTVGFPTTGDLSNQPGNAAQLAAEPEVQNALFDPTAHG
jgi:hypothetical protein